MSTIRWIPTTSPATYAHGSAKKFPSLNVAKTSSSHGVKAFDEGNTGYSGQLNPLRKQKNDLLTEVFDQIKEHWSIATLAGFPIRAMQRKKKLMNAQGTTAVTRYRGEKALFFTLMDITPLPGNRCSDSIHMIGSQRLLARIAVWPSSMTPAVPLLTEARTAVATVAWRHLALATEISQDLVVGSDSSESGSV